jgi:hypothetical protein
MARPESRRASAGGRLQAQSDTVEGYESARIAAGSLLSLLQQDGGLKAAEGGGSGTAGSPARRRQRTDGADTTAGVEALLALLEPAPLPPLLNLRVRRAPLPHRALEALAQKPLKISVEGGGAVSVRGAGLPRTTTQWRIESTALEQRLAAAEAALARKEKDLERAQRRAAEQDARISRLEERLETQSDGRRLALSGYHLAVSERAALEGAHEAGAEEAARAAAAAQAAHEAELADASSVAGAFRVVSGAVAQAGGPDERKRLWARLIEAVKAAANCGSTGRKYVAEQREVVNHDVAMDQAEEQGRGLNQAVAHYHRAVSDLRARMRDNYHKLGGGRKKDGCHRFVDPRTGDFMQVDMLKDKVTKVESPLYKLFMRMLTPPFAERQNQRLRQALEIEPFLQYYPRGASGPVWTRDQVEESLAIRLQKVESKVLLLMDVVVHMAFHGQEVCSVLLLQLATAMSAGGGLTEHAHDLASSVGLLPHRSTVDAIVNSAAAAYKDNFPALYKKVLDEQISP